MDSIFVTTLVLEKVRVPPQDIDRNIKKTLMSILNAKFEGKCSQHGFIKRKSIKIVKFAMGQVQVASLNGDATYMVNFQADVCNPMIGSVIRAKVMKINSFGIFAECGTTVDGKYVSIIEVLVARKSTTMVNEIPLENFKENDIIHVEIRDKKYELNDKRIGVVGRTVNKKATYKLDNGEPDEEDDDDDVDVDVVDGDPVEDDEEKEDEDEEDDDEKSEKDEKEEEEEEEDEFGEEEDEEGSDANDDVSEAGSD